MNRKTSFTFQLLPDQATELIRLLRTGNYRLVAVPHATLAAEGPACRICLYPSGKCLAQGQGAEEWVLYVLEPEILKQARTGYETVVDPQADQPHMGVDESGKGDFFGPLVIAAAYVDERTAPELRALNVRDSKRITSDPAAEKLAAAIRRVLHDRWTVVAVGPRAYNRLYARMQNVNRILAWGHARAIENLLDKVPDCPRALSDQFGPTRQIEQALMQKGRAIQLVQRPRAESDVAVAAASVLARTTFVGALRELQRHYELPIPKGASDQVRQSARQLIEKHGPQVLLETAKCHFRTTDALLAELKLGRAALGPDGQAVSKASRAPTVSPNEPS